MTTACTRPNRQAIGEVALDRIFPTGSRGFYVIPLCSRLCKLIGCTNLGRRQQLVLAGLLDAKRSLLLATCTHPLNFTGNFPACLLGFTKVHSNFPSRSSTFSWR